MGIASFNRARAYWKRKIEEAANNPETAGKNEVNTKEKDNGTKRQHKVKGGKASRVAGEDSSNG